MAATLTQKLEQLDSIIKGAKKIQKQVMETIVAENILHDEINRFTDILHPDEEHRDYIRYKGVIAKHKMRKQKKVPDTKKDAGSTKDAKCLNDAPSFRCVICGFRTAGKGYTRCDECSIVGP